MRRILMILILASSVCSASGQDSAARPAEEDPFWANLKQAIEKHLGKPYVWGACGMKSFDCSGFLWRVMADNGILVKRTTARKFYVSLRKPDKEAVYRPGNIVFFDDLKHVGIIADKRTFYHAAVTRGTHLAEFDPYWRPMVFGFRAMPRPRQ